MNQLTENDEAFESMLSDPSSIIEEQIQLVAPIMAICTDSSRHGSAIYIDSSIRLVADRKDPGDPYRGLDHIIQRIAPSVVIVSCVQKRLINFLENRFSFKICDLGKKSLSKSSAKKKDKEAPTENTEQINTEVDLGLATDESLVSFTLVIVPNIWFSISASLNKLVASELVKAQGLVELEDKSFYITSKVDRAADVCALRAIAAIESYLVSNYVTHPNSSRVDGEHEESINIMPILDVKYIDPGPILSIDKPSFRSLHIFPSRKINDSQNQNSNDTIPSLYELLNLCQSSQGKKQLNTIMMWPLQDVQELMYRHDAVEFFINPANRLLREQISIQMKNVVPLTGLLTKLSHSIGSHKELTALYKALWALIGVMDLIKANSGHGVRILARIDDLDTDELRKTVDSIINIVDFESSRREKRVQVYFGIDQEVDEKKELVKNLSKFCDEVAVQETAKYRDTLAKIFKVIYIPRIGFLDSVDYSSVAELDRIYASKEFDVLLHTENSVYFKTKRTEELDMNAGDVACDLIDVQENVVLNLQNELLKYTESILQLTELCGELDCLIAFAVVSLQRGYTRPEFLAVGQDLDICGMYHPLHCVKLNMKPNDVKFYKENSERPVKVAVITGPNSCGKTTYMKATCLTIYMAHIGCFVPAIQAKIPPFDAILTRMHSGTSISTGLSSFATDLYQINYALSRATDKSFIAIDEFGKGTQARDGFHLLKGLVAYFAKRAQASPYVVVATHFNRLIEHLRTYSEYILYKTFKVVRDTSKNRIVYEYQIIDGVGEASFADKVAIKAGVPASIVERANQIRDYITEDRAILPRRPNAA